MKKKYSVIIAVLFSVIISIPANAEWREDNKSIEEESFHIKSVQDFGAQLWLTADVDVFDKWNTMTPGFKIADINKAERGMPILPLIIFANPGEKEGLCDVTCDIVVRLPSGEIYGERKNANCWKGLPPPLAI